MGLYKRKKVWHMSFIYAGKQIRKSTEATNKKDAEDIYCKVKTQIREGKYFDVLEEKNKTFADLMDRYMIEISSKKASYRREVSIITNNLIPFFGDYILAGITPKVIVQYKSKRYIFGAAPATINRELSVMKHAFNVAIREWEWCRENPVSKVTMEKVDNQVDRWLTYDEEKRLLDETPKWLREIIVFALNAGMRKEEILSLKWQDVDLFRKTATVVKSKNKEKRTIPLNNTLVGLLKVKAKVRYLKCDYVFSSSARTKIDQSNLNRPFKNALKKADIQNFRFHDLRHTFATRLIQMGVDLYKVQRLLGHKSPIMTQRYAHHFSESLRDGVEVLDGVSSDNLSQIYHNGVKA